MTHLLPHIQSDSANQAGVLAVRVATHNLELVLITNTEAVGGAEEDGEVGPGLDDGGAAPQSAVHLQPAQPGPGTSWGAALDLGQSGSSSPAAWAGVRGETGEGRQGGLPVVLLSSALLWLTTIRDIRRDTELKPPTVLITTGLENSYQVLSAVISLSQYVSYHTQDPAKLL